MRVFESEETELRSLGYQDADESSEIGETEPELDGSRETDDDRDHSV